MIHPTADSLRNQLATLYSLDHGEVPWMSPQAWAAFIDHPCSYYLRCSSEIREKIWAAIERRRRENRSQSA